MWTEAMRSRLEKASVGDNPFRISIVAMGDDIQSALAEIVRLRKLLVVAIAALDDEYPETAAELRKDLGEWANP